MAGKVTILLGAIAAVAALSACDRNKDPQLLNVKANGDGPDG